MTKSNLEQKRVYSGLRFQKERVHYGEGKACQPSEKVWEKEQKVKRLKNPRASPQ